eukprot:9054-Heterococcus_DN1.PRE.4
MQCTAAIDFTSSTQRAFDAELRFTLCSTSTLTCAAKVLHCLTTVTAQYTAVHLLVYTSVKNGYLRASFINKPAVDIVL